MMKIKDFLIKNKQIVSYLFFGGVTTVVSVLSFAILDYAGLDELIANIFSWILAVFVAFITNTLWVFGDTLKVKPISKMLKFYVARISTLVIEEALLFIFVKLLFLNPLAVKIVAQVIVVVLNYVISKLFVFKK